MNNDNNIDKRKIRKIVKIIVVLTIAFMIVNSVINIVEPIIDLQSVIMAKSYKIYCHTIWICSSVFTWLNIFYYINV